MKVSIFSDKYRDSFGFGLRIRSMNCCAIYVVGELRGGIRVKVGLLQKNKVCSVFGERH